MKIMAVIIAATLAWSFQSSADRFRVRVSEAGFFTSVASWGWPYNVYPMVVKTNTSSAPIRDRLSFPWCYGYTALAVGEAEFLRVAADCDEAGRVEAKSRIRFFPTSEKVPVISFEVRTDTWTRPYHSGSITLTDLTTGEVISNYAWGGPDPQDDNIPWDSTRMAASIHPVLRFYPTHEYELTLAARSGADADQIAAEIWVTGLELGVVNGDFAHDLTGWSIAVEGGSWYRLGSPVIPLQVPFSPTELASYLMKAAPAPLDEIAKVSPSLEGNNLTLALEAPGGNLPMRIIDPAGVEFQWIPYDDTRVTASQKIFMKMGDVLSGWARFDPYAAHQFYHHKAWVQVANGASLQQTWFMDIPLDLSLYGERSWDLPNLTPWLYWDFIAPADGWYTLVLGEANCVQGSSRAMFERISVSPAPVIEVRTPRLVQQGNTFDFDLVGPTGKTCAVQVSADLVNWSTHSFHTIPETQRLRLTDLGPSNHQQRYFRALPLEMDMVAVIPATAASLLPPFTVTNGVVFQPVLTLVPAEGGRAAFDFTITNRGNYVIEAVVDANNAGQNSFFVGLDREPYGPQAIWDIPVTQGFERRVIGCRGDGTPEVSQYPRLVFTLNPGNHRLILRGREENTFIRSIIVLEDKHRLLQ